MKQHPEARESGMEPIVTAAPSPCHYTSTRLALLPHRPHRPVLGWGRLPKTVTGHVQGMWSGEAVKQGCGQAPRRVGPPVTLVRANIIFRKPRKVVLFFGKIHQDFKTPGVFFVL